MKQPVIIIITILAAIAITAAAADETHPTEERADPADLCKALLSTCLHFANVDRVRELIAAGANVSCTDDVGDTPLHNAIFRVVGTGAGAGKHVTGVVNALVAAGARLDARNDVHSTPLHIAAAAGIDEIVTVLLRAGADKTPLRDKWTPSGLARARGHFTTAKLIDQFGMPEGEKEVKKPYEWTIWHGMRDFAIMPCWEWLQSVFDAAVAESATIFDGRSIVAPPWIRDSRPTRSLVIAAAVLVAAALCWAFLWVAEHIAYLLRMAAVAVMCMAAIAAVVAAMMAADEYAKRCN
jgi:hypothetical protein